MLVSGDEPDTNIAIRVPEGAIFYCLLRSAMI